jgi:uncharacterized membrane protein YsdA (DUF1294 family)
VPDRHTPAQPVSCGFPDLRECAVPTASILAFAVLYAGATYAWRVPALVAAVYLGASLLCFIVYAMDKAAARAGERRTPERTLLMLGLFCGWPGAVLARHWLRHKSGKASFQAPFRATVAVNIAAFIYLSWPGSFLHGF